ncbi:MAG: lipoprotein-releasing system transmembrane subunit LolC, partial [Candidatus Dadabacteria bacterium]
MKTSFRRLIATRYLLSKRKEAFISIITIISVIGVAVGVIVINVAMAIMTGFEFELRKKIVASDSHITVRKLKGGIGNWESIGKEIRRVKGVSDVSPFTYHQALLKTKLGTVGVLIRGVKKDTSTARQLMKSISGDLKEGLFSYSLAKNEPKSTANLAGMVIGRELSRTLSLHVGDKVTVISPMAGSSPLGLIPRFRRFVISGIYSSGLSGYESTLVYIDLGTAQEFFRLRNSITGF